VSIKRTSKQKKSHNSFNILNLHDFLIDESKGITCRDVPESISFLYFTLAEMVWREELISLTA